MKHKRHCNDKMLPIVQRVVMNELSSKKAGIQMGAIQSVTVVIAMLLHDHYNFSTDMINELFGKMTYNMECIGDKYVKIEDFNKWCDENGIIISFDS